MKNEITDSTFVNEEFLIGLDQPVRAPSRSLAYQTAVACTHGATSRLALTENIKRADKEKKTAGGLDIEGIRGSCGRKISAHLAYLISETCRHKELVIHLAREFFSSEEEIIQGANLRSVRLRRGSRIQS